MDETLMDTYRYLKGIEFDLQYKGKLLENEIKFPI